MPILIRTFGSHGLTSPGDGLGHVLQALREPADVPGQDLARIFLAQGIAGTALPDPPPAGELGRRSIGGSLIVALTVPRDAPLRYPFFGVDQPVPASAPETDLFAGRDCVLAERNGETLETVRDWILWHRAHHRMTGLVMLDRARPEDAATFARELERDLDGKVDLAGEHDGPDAALKIVSISSDLPLGKPDAGPEAHPFMAPDAPGKDRMEVPENDPWTAPLGAGAVFETLRWRFLARAGAVMNIDMHDLLPPVEDAMLAAADSSFDGDLPATVFDCARQVASGVVLLTGERVYPWSIRKGRSATFGDHICRRFDSYSYHRRWCIAPDKAPESVTWRLTRIVGVDDLPVALRFYRCMALRFDSTGAHDGKVSRLVPKSSLVESEQLIALAKRMGFKPLRMPEVKVDPVPEATSDRVVIVTCMKNEGPFILEWLAYHRSIGVDDVLVYTNDCTDGTDTFLDLLQEKGLVQHRDNPFKGTDLKPQHAALAAAEDEDVVKNAGWVMSMDVDEFINVHAGEGTLQDLFAAVPHANMISMTWRLFGNGDVEEFRDEFLTERFTRCAPQMTRKPHQAWGFKTMFRNIGLFKKLGVHRPKGLKPQLVQDVRWVNGSGQPMPRKEYRNAWRSTTRTVGYKLVTLNHYALRSAESFLVKRDRGRVNHVDRDQGLHYWFRMNNNADEDRSIQRAMPRMKAEHARLLADPDIARAHQACVAAHRARIDVLKASPEYAAFYQDLIGERLRRLSRRHLHFGSAVFLAGPQVIPDEALRDDLPDTYFFTVPES
ncbi:glycosyltransferase family 2 protein [Chachezhania antarctica]|uniref:glycosyltransferase family 2 protein n=1 Tax=Chachezhania antarctica TaxID=2340860 RepID=UPI000EAD99FD|nr:glycosyltransferase family 2 protein [Chachezhania antarctica]